MAALSYVFENAEEKAIVLKAINGFRSVVCLCVWYGLHRGSVVSTMCLCGYHLGTSFSMCASVAANYELNQVFDKLVISLCKFTTLLNPPEV